MVRRRVVRYLDWLVFVVAAIAAAIVVVTNASTSISTMTTTTTRMTRMLSIRPYRKGGSTVTTMKTTNTLSWLGNLGNIQPIRARDVSHVQTSRRRRFVPLTTTTTTTRAGEAVRSEEAPPIHKMRQQSPSRSQSQTSLLSFVRPFQSARSTNSYPFLQHALHSQTHFLLTAEQMSQHGKQQQQQRLYSTTMPASDDIDWSLAKGTTTSSSSSSPSKFPKPMYYRADRVMGNRCSKSRSQCADLIKFRRVYELVEYSDNKDDENNEIPEHDKVVELPPSFHSLQQMTTAGGPSSSSSSSSFSSSSMMMASSLSSSINQGNESETTGTAKTTTTTTNNTTTNTTMNVVDVGDEVVGEINGEATTDTTSTAARITTTTRAQDANKKDAVCVRPPDPSHPRYYWRIVTGPSVHIAMNALLFIDKKEAIPLPPPLLAVYHKPKWVLSVRKDRMNMNRPCLDPDFLLPQLHPVGRLDYDSSGLLLFSSNGKITQVLLHPKHGIAKEYVATVTGIVHFESLAKQLVDGVMTSDGIITAELLSVQCMESHVVKPYLDNIRQGLPPEYNQTDLSKRGYLDVLDATELSIVRVIVHEGKYRMVRRLLANCGHPVVTLHRQRIGDVVLDETTLPPGHWRTLTPKELKWTRTLYNETIGRDQQQEQKKKKSYNRRKRIEKIKKKEAEDLVKEQQAAQQAGQPIPKQPKMSQKLKTPAEAMAAKKARIRQERIALKKRSPKQKKRDDDLEYVLKLTREYDEENRMREIKRETRKKRQQQQEQQQQSNGGGACMPGGGGGGRGSTTPPLF